MKSPAFWWGIFLGILVDGKDRSKFVWQDLFTRTKETGFFTLFADCNASFRKKPGFWAHA